MMFSCKLHARRPIAVGNLLLRPMFISEPNSLDGTFQCDDNIHPMEVGGPEAEPGCQDRTLDYMTSAKRLRLIH